MPWDIESGPGRPNGPLCRASKPVAIPAGSDSQVTEVRRVPTHARYRPRVTVGPGTRHRFAKRGMKGGRRLRTSFAITVYVVARMGGAQLTPSTRPASVPLQFQASSVDSWRWKPQAVRRLGLLRQVAVAAAKHSRDDPARKIRAATGRRVPAGAEVGRVRGEAPVTTSPRHGQVGPTFSPQARRRARYAGARARPAARRGAQERPCDHCRPARPDQA